MLELVKDISPIIIQEFFRFLNNREYDFRHRNTFEIPFCSSVYNGTELIFYLVAKIWGLVPDNLKSLTSFSIFKGEIKKWNPEYCSCRICETYIQYIIYVLHTLLS